MKRPTTNDFEASDYAVGRSYLTMQSDGAGSRSGVFTSPHGLARVLDSWGGHRPSTLIIFIREGRSYSRSWPTTWGDRTLARLARELIDDVVAGRAE